MSRRLRVSCVVVVTLLVGITLGAQQPAEWVGAPISMSLRDVTVGTALNELAERARMRLAVETGLSLDDPVTVELDRVPWDQALDQLTKVNRLRAYVVDGIIVVASGIGGVGLSSQG